MKQALSIILLFVVIFIHAQPGSGDSSFNPSDLGFGIGDGANDYVKDIVIQPDGKFLIGGDFTTYNSSTAKSLARINADGSLDSSFLIGSGANDYVSAIVTQPDGKILVCGSFTTFNGVTKNRIVRLNPNGTTDTTFVIGTGADGVVECVVMQDDGKIIIGGQFTKFNGVVRKYIARLNVNGSLDTTFDSGAGFNSHVYSIAIQGDGKIIAGGNFTSYNSVSQNYIVRLNSDASVDNTFVSSGFNNIAYIIQLSNDGKILVGGKFTKYNNVTKNGIVKLSEDGSLDDTFTIGFGANNVIRNILVLEDGKYLLGGDFTAYAETLRNYIARINANGTIDPSFNPGKGFGSSVTSFQQQSDGKLLIGGSYTVFNNNVRHYLARLEADGAIDYNFNPGNAADGQIRSVALQANQKMVIVGNFNSFNDVLNNRIARIDQDGNVDTTLQTGTGADQVIRTVASQSDNKIIIGGNFTTFNTAQKSYLARLNSSGSLDNDFNIGYGPTDVVRDILIQPDGKILICGDFTVFNTKTFNRIIRLNVDGTIDTSFQPVSGANNSIYSMKLQTDNKIVISGNFTTYDGIARNRLARINSDGTLDGSFTIGTGANGVVNNIVIQNDGKIVIGGNFTTLNGVTSTRIARVNADGSRDASLVSTVGANALVESIILQENGKILIGGSFTKYNNLTRNYIARLNADGTLDESFNRTLTGANKPIYKLITQEEKYIAVGDFTAYNGIGRNRITRIIGGEEIHLSTNSIDVKKVKIYPNPTSEKLFISSDLNLIKFEIYDLSGKRLIVKELKKDINSIDVSDFKKGVYILELSDDKGKIHSQKFIIE